MKVVCDNCRAVYKVPNEKLTKPVNKATCRSCGHRMLIPRARPGADPEERTLVTAVPPTPVGAPPRLEDRATAPLEDDREETLPGRDDVPVFAVSTPLPTSRDTVPGDLEEPENTGPGTSWVQHPNRDDSRPTLPSQNPRTSGSVPVGLKSAPPGPRSPVSRTPIASPVRQVPAPAADRRATPRQAPPRAATPAPAPSRATPGPAPSRGGTPGPAPARVEGLAAHDPFFDLLWCLAGTIAALVGTLLLSSLSLFNHWVVLWAGLLLAFGGCATAILILLSSRLGRQPAWSTASVVVGTLIAFTAAAGLTGAQIVTVKVVEEGIEGINFAAVKLPGSSTPAPAPDPSLAAVQPAPAPADPNAPTEVAAAEPTAVVPAPEAAPEPEPEPVAVSPKPGPKSAPEPKPAPGPAPVTAPKPAPPPPAPAVAAVSYEVVDILLRNNISVKRCFVPLAQAGALPKRVDVRFTLATTGKASGVSISTPSELAGSDFERCMASAIATIEFPAGGASQKFTYPFQLQ